MSDGGRLRGDVRLGARLHVDGEGKPLPFVETSGAGLYDGREHAAWSPIQVEGRRAEEWVGRELASEEGPARWITLEADRDLGTDRLGRRAPSRGPRRHHVRRAHRRRYRRDSGTDV